MKDTIVTCDNCRKKWDDEYSHHGDAEFPFTIKRTLGDRTLFFNMVGEYDISVAEVHLCSVKCVAEFLEKKLKKDVDVVYLSSVHPFIMRFIRKELIYA